MQTPVVLLVFNRPTSTARVLQRVRAARPARLTVVSDGPRPGRTDDRATVAEVRALIDELVDWPCEVRRDYAEKNLGCGPRVASGLTAAFGVYDRAMVLEDDTLPEPSFFPFCEAMLDRYAHDPGVVHVSGTNAAAALKKVPATDSYRLNRVPDIWGWATWSRAWRHYDLGLSEWADTRTSGWLESLLPFQEEQAVFREAFDLQHELADDPVTWDWSWIYACLRHGRTVTPMRNLVTNVGFGPDGTHTHSPDDLLASLPSEPIRVDRLTAPEDDPRDELDTALLAHRFNGAKLRRRATLLGRLTSGRLLRKLRRLIREAGVAPVATEKASSLSRTR